MHVSMINNNFEESLKINSTENDEGSKKSRKCILLLIIISVLILSIFSGLLLYIGIRFKNECPMEENLPKVMIISNLVFLILINSFALLMINAGLCENPSRTGLKKCCYWSINCILMAIILISLICFFISNGFSGSYTRRYKNIRQFDNPTNKRTYCHPAPYYASMAFFCISAFMTLLAFISCCRDKFKSSKE